ncbi:MAG: helix-turn-helix domain-containing protein, partial [Bdellovibrionota bacterium]
DDILLIARSYLGCFAQALRKPALRLSPEAEAKLLAYAWPGNIRELQNTVERMKILCDGERIRLIDVPGNIRVGGGIRSEHAKTSIHPTTRNQEFEPELPLDTIEKNHILRTLQHHSGNKTKAAQSLGITIKTLYNKLHRYGVLTTQPPQEISQETATVTKENVT